MGALIDIKTTEVFCLDSYPGVEVEVRTAVSMRDFVELQRLADLANPGDMATAVDAFGAAYIERWNISVDGQALPVSGESFARLPMALQLEVVNKFMAYMRGPSGPLGRGFSMSSGSPGLSTGEQDSG